MSRGVYEFTQGAETEMQALNTKVPDLSVRIPEATDSVTSTQSVPAGSTYEEVVITKGFERITIFATGIGGISGADVKLFLLDEAGNRLGAAWQTIDTGGVYSFDISWPQFEMSRGNSDTVAHDITVSYALR